MGGLGKAEFCYYRIAAFRDPKARYVMPSLYGFAGPALGADLSFTRVKYIPLFP
jgi:hypothetical protein